MIFVELKQQYQFSELALKRVIDGIVLRKYVVGIILCADGLHQFLTGELGLIRSETSIDSTISKKNLSLLSDAALSESVKIFDDFHLGAMLLWTEANFARFGFDLIAHMQGTYDSGRVSSLYGFGRTRMLTASNPV